MAALGRLGIINLIALGLGIYMAMNKKRNVALWGLACLFFPPATIILAFLPRVIRQEDITRCPGCQNIILKGSDRCPQCGTSTPIDMVECKSCGKFVPEGTKCPECGAPL